MDDTVIPTSPKGRERIIEEAIMDHPERLGFPGANSIRTLRVSPDSGLVDIVLLPKHGPDLVLVEAKAANAHDAASKVIGQLLMYYAGALMLGADGLSAIVSFATNHKDEARSESKISHFKLTDISPAAKAWDKLTKGTRLAPKQVRMFVALDDEPRPALKIIIATLRQHHSLPIGLVVVKDGKPTVRLPAD